MLAVVHFIACLEMGLFSPPQYIYNVWNRSNREQLTSIHEKQAIKLHFISFHFQIYQEDSHTSFKYSGQNKREETWAVISEDTLRTSYFWRRICWINISFSKLNLCYFLHWYRIFLFESLCFVLSANY